MSSAAADRRMALSMGAYAEAIDVSAADADLGSPHALFVGTGGDIKVDMARDGATEIIFKNIPDGTFLPIIVTKVYTADTDAADIIILK